MFLIFGPLILLASILTDAFWFIAKTCKMDDNKKTSAQTFVLKLAAFNKLRQIVDGINEKQVPAMKIIKKLRVQFEPISCVKNIMFAYEDYTKDFNTYENPNKVLNV